MAILKATVLLSLSSAFDNANHHVIDHLGISAFMNRPGYEGGQLVYVISLWQSDWQVADSNLLSLRQVDSVARFSESLVFLMPGGKSTPLCTVH